MARKSFQKYLEKRLTKQEIADIERQAMLEKKILDQEPQLIFKKK